MIPNDALINALRSLKFKFKRQTDRVAIYKQRGTTLRVTVRRKASHDEIFARTVLTQAGMPAAEVEKFIAAASR